LHKQATKRRLCHIHHQGRKNDFGITGYFNRSTCMRPVSEVRAPQFDEIIRAEDLCEPEELDRLRFYLDKQLQNLSSVVARLANRLQRRLMAQQNRAWEFDLEEGMLDPARLTRVIVDPQTPLSFKQEKDTITTTTKAINFYDEQLAEFKTQMMNRSGDAPKI